MNSTVTPPFRCISATEAASLIRREHDAMVFDVRDALSYQRGHLEGAAHLSEDRLAAWFRRLPKEVPVVIYCYRGNASQAYARMFADFHYQRVYSVDGGYEPLAAALAAPGSSDLQTFLAANDFPPDDLDARRRHGLTPLMRAALDGRRELVQELIALGVDLDARNDDGNTALWLACVARDKGMVEDLIAAGIALDNRNEMGATALMYTASSDRPELLDLLLTAGADPNVANIDDMRAVDLAASVACLKRLRRTA